MEKDSIINVLYSLGYTNKEAQVYLANLEQGTVPASMLGKCAKLNRVTTYETLKKLQGKGIVTVSLIKGIKHFSAIEPQALLVATQNRVEALAQAVPKLTKLASTAHNQHTVQLFEGLSGIKRAYEDTLKSKTVILGYANSKNIRQHWPEYDEAYVAKRAQQKIFFRGLAPLDKMGKYVQAEDDLYFRETRLISQKQFSSRKLENEIKIYDGKMLIVSYAPEQFAILTESQAVYETQKQIFEIMWEYLSP